MVLRSNPGISFSVIPQYILGLREGFSLLKQIYCLNTGDCSFKFGAWCTECHTIPFLIYNLQFTNTTIDFSPIEPALFAAEMQPTTSWRDPTRDATPLPAFWRTQAKNQSGKEHHSLHEREHHHLSAVAFKCPTYLYPVGHFALTA